MFGETATSASAIKSSTAPSWLMKIRLWFSLRIGLE
jgi:hypothetical protein